MLVNAVIHTQWTDYTFILDGQTAQSPTKSQCITIWKGNSYSNVTL